MIKYPLEIELTNNCNLNCISCISYQLKKGTMKIETFDTILSFVKKNYQDIEFFTIAGLGDNFLHSQINNFLNKLMQLKGYNIPLVVPTKAIGLSSKIIDKIKKLQIQGIKLNLQIGIYSLREDISNFLCGLYDSKRQCFKFNYYEIFKEKIRLLKKNGLDFSLELLLTKFSEDEIDYFHKFCDSLGVEGVVHKLHNFGGRLNTYNLLYSKIKPETKCAGVHLKEYESSYYNDLCAFYPFIDNTGTVYPGSFCFHYNLGKIDDYNFAGGMKKIVKKCYEVIDLNNKFCKKCSDNPLYNQV